MKPLKLYTRTTILTAAILTATLLLVVIFFVIKVRSLELQEQEQQAKLLATQLANLLAYEAPNRTLQARLVVNSFAEAHAGQVLQIRIYGENRRGELSEEINTLADDPEEIERADMPALRRGEPVARMRQSEDEEGRRKVIRAVAPIFDGNVFRGAVSLTTPRSEFSVLSRRIITLALALLAVAILATTAAFYLLFSQVLYKPVEDFLQLTLAVKGGRLDIAAPVRAPDEFGELAISFNHMIARLRAMTEEREAYQRQLEARVREATTELTERNAQLEEANATLFEIQRELTKFERLAAAGQMAAQLAHEVGTPLNLISGHVQLLAARTADDKTRGRLELVSEQIARIERIVRNLLDTTRRPRPTLEPVDVNALLRRIFDVTAPTLLLRQVKLNAELDGQLPPIDGDPDQLQQIFLNLINNSLDAMPGGGTLTFVTAAASEPGYVQVSCRDTGEGIDDESRQRIFDPLFTTKPAGRGSGLGLTIVQQIVREHGGQIEVSSDAQRGAQFVLRFPVAQRVEAAIAG